MPKGRGASAFCAVVATCLIALPSPATASSVSDFYTGKRIKLLISSGVGGAYDLYGRLFARHMGSYIPGKPDIIPQNLPGAGGMKVLNFAYNQGAKDGTLIFTLHIGLPLHQALGRRGVRYDAGKIIGIGRLAAGNSATTIWHTAGVKTYRDVLNKEVTVGATSASSNSAVFPTVAANLLGAKIKVIKGYKSSETVHLAMQRGEVQGSGSESLASTLANHPDYITKKLIYPLFQWGLRREKLWANVPLASELAKNDIDRRALEVLSAQMDIGRSYYLPPGVPKDRVAALRNALRNTVQDASFKADAKKARAEIRYASGPETEKMIAAVLAAPKNVLDRLKAASKVKTTGLCQDYTAASACRPPKKGKKKKRH